MEQREKKIIEAAQRVFNRYGVKRASMNDIAAEAGLARQTLYNVYANKDEILKGAIRLYCETSLATVEEELPGIPNLSGKITLVLHQLSLKPYIDLHNSPNAQDLIEGYNQKGKDALEETGLAYCSVLERLLAPYEDTIAEAGMTSSKLAEVIRRAATALKYQARDKSHLEVMLSTLTAMAVAIAQAD